MEQHCIVSFYLYFGEDSKSKLLWRKLLITFDRFKFIFMLFYSQHIPLGIDEVFLYIYFY